MKIFDIRKQNHKKPTNIFNFLTFLGRKSLEEDHRVPTFAIATGKYAPPIKQNEEILRLFPHFTRFSFRPQRYNQNTNFANHAKDFFMFSIVKGGCSPFTIPQYYSIH